MNTKEIITDYYNCWIKNDRDGARAFLVDTLKFRSPQDNFNNADDFMNKCWKFADGFDRMDIEHLIFNDEGGYIVYSGDNFCCGELLKIKDGKISEIYVTFDPTK